MTTTQTQVISAGSVPTFADEFVGLMFYGTGHTPKGKFVSARRAGPGRRRIEFTFERPTPFGPLSVVEYPGGATVRFEEKP